MTDDTTTVGLPTQASEAAKIAPPVALTIAGFDPGSGAGVTADLKTFAAHGVFGTAAITALTVQSTRGVRSVQPVDAGLLRDTLAELLADLPPAGVKIGMLADESVAAVVGEFVQALRLRSSDEDAPRIPIVLDPVLRSSSGHALLSVAGTAVVLESLLPWAGIVTPNWAELAVLSGLPVGSLEEAGNATAALAGRYPGLTVVATGGDNDPPVDQVRLASGETVRCDGERVNTTSTHGTGCAFSSAILANLINGFGTLEAITAAKAYVAEALRQAPGIGSGRGPLGLLWPLKRS